MSFDPWKAFKNVYVPFPVLGDLTLSEGAKLLYGVLVSHYGKPRPNRICNPRLDVLAAEMAVSIDTVHRWMKELTDQRYVIRHRGGPGRPSTCTFLPHPRLVPEPAELQGKDSAELQGQKESDSADLRIKNPQNCGLESAKLQGHYKEETIQETTQETIHPPPQVPPGLAAGEEEEEDSPEVERTPHDIERIREFMRLCCPKPKLYPSDECVFSVLNIAPTWSVEEIITAWKVNADKRDVQKGRSYGYFEVVFKDIYEGRKGIPPKPAKPRLPEPPQTAGPESGKEQRPPTEEEARKLQLLKEQSELAERDRSEFVELMEKASKAVRDQLALVCIDAYPNYIRAEILRYLRTGMVKPCKACKCTGMRLDKPETPSGPEWCTCRFAASTHTNLGEPLGVVH